MINKKIKVIMIGPYPANSIYGGISAVISTYLSSNLIEKYQILYIQTSSPKTKFNKITRLIISIFKLIYLFISTDIKIVHINTASGISFYRKACFLFISKIFHKKVCLHIHGGGFNSFYCSGFKIKRWLIGKVLNSANVIIVVSNFWIKIIQQQTDNKNIVRIYNPVNVINYLSCHNHIRNYNKFKNIIFMSRLDLKKGIYDLLETIPLVIEKESNVRFILCGYGDIPRLKKICKKKCITKYVKFTGWIKGKEKIIKLCNSHIFLLPSYIEGLPVSILEAMAAKLPIVATRVGGIPDIIDNGINGFLVQPGDIKDIADKIIILLKDKKFREKIGEENIKKVRKNFDINKIADQLNLVYQKSL